MKSMSMKSLIPMVALATLGTASVASAGHTYSAASCYQYADSSGYCYGNFLAFRNDATTTTYASFRETDAATRSFYARFTVSGATTPSTYTCIPDATVSAMWAQALDARGYFYVSWDASGTCTYLALNNGSSFANY
ncbi:hypothetical protein ACN47A_03885 [Myxococcus fulvus]|uniref:hypothetical protein n=1 Tax=Myxococcus fulvus TaxID=33 RepID=UPI003B9BBCC2